MTTLLENDKTNNQEFFSDVLRIKNEHFIRKGIIGGHKSEMSQEYIDRFDKWIAEKENLNQGFAHNSLL